MRRRLRLAAYAMAAVCVVAGAGLLLLPRLADVNRYRGSIEARARELLGRNVRLGELDLSLRPLGLQVRDLAVEARPEEGGGDLLSARRLRVGARLLPLLSRRLEVTSASLEGLALTLERGEDGSWNIERLFAPAPTEAPVAGESQGGGGLTIASFELRDGRVIVRDRRAKPAREIVLSGIDLSADTSFRSGALDVDLSLAPGAEQAGRLTYRGSLGSPLRPAGAAFEIDGQLTLDDVPGERLAELLALAAGRPVLADGLVGPGKLDGSLEVAGTLAPSIAVELRKVSFEGLDLGLRRQRAGSWALLAPEGPKPKTRAKLSTEPPPVVELRGVKLTRSRLRLRDESAGARPFELTLDDVSLELDRLPGEAPAALSFAAALASGGRLSAHGQLGAVGDKAGGNDLTLEARAVPLAMLAPWIGTGSSAVDVSKGTVDFDARITGGFPDRFRGQGQLSLKNGELLLKGVAAAASEERAALAFTAAATLERAGASNKIEIARADLDLGGHPLSLSGSVTTGSGSEGSLDLTLAPTSIGAGELAALLASFQGPQSFRLSAGAPIELEARVHGPFGGGRAPAVEGRARLTDATLALPGLSRPIENLSARVSFSGDRAKVEEASLSIGATDLAGELSVENFASPKLSFKLSSQRADLDELFALGGSAGAPAPPPETDAAATSALARRLEAKGTLSIAEGRWRAMAFRELEGSATLARGVLRLDPVRMTLYAGLFSGSAVYDLNVDPASFELQGDSKGIDIGALISETAGVKGLLTGRLTGELRARGRGSERDAILKSLSGDGALRVDQGGIGQLDVLGSMRQVAGLFGEKTLAALANRLSSSGTTFDRLSSGVRLEKGLLKLEGALLESADFRLDGHGDVDLTSSRLDGAFNIVFSEELSASMYREGSRAGEVFWNPSTRRVELPLTLKGSFASPSPNVDWQATAGKVVKRQVAQTLTGFLGKALGGSEPAPQPPSGASGADAASLGAELTELRWGGSFLVRDLKIRGLVRGPRLASASLTVSDARGREIQRIEPVAQLAEYLSSAAEPEAPAAVAVSVSIEGKKLALVGYPLTIKLTVLDRDGQRAEVSQSLAR